MIFTKLDEQIQNTTKDFLFFNSDKDNNIKEYIITNDYHRHKNKYSNAMSIENIKKLAINL